MVVSRPQESSNLHSDRGTQSVQHLDLGTNYVHSDYRNFSGKGVGVLGLVAVGLLLFSFLLVFTLFVWLRLHSAQGRIPGNNLQLRNFNVATA